MLTNEQLAAHLPSGAYSNYTLNLAALGTANISIVGWLPPLLKGVAKLITEVNLVRQTANPPLDPIDLAVESINLDSTSGKVQIQYAFNFNGDLSNIAATIVDPTAPSASTSAIGTTSTPPAASTAPTPVGTGTQPGAPGTGILQP